MDVKSKWAFKRLVDELSQDQYERMITVLQQSDLSMPGWSDRLAPESEAAVPPVAVRVLVPLEDLVRAVALSRTTRRADYYNDPKGGVWLLASEQDLRVCGSDDYAASYMDLSATVDVPGSALVDSRDLWQIIEALRKGTPRAQRSTAHVTLETEGEDYLRVGVGGRSHRAKLLRRRTADPLLPPKARALLQVSDGAAFRRGVLHVLPSVDLNATRGSNPTDLNHVGLRSTSGVLTIDAQQSFRAAQASVPSTSDVVLEQLVHYLWLREVAAAIGTGGIGIGHVPEAGPHGLVMITGDHWAAWTSQVLPWRSRFVPATVPAPTTITFHRDDVHRHLVDAKRIADASWVGKNSNLVCLAVTKGSLEISSLHDAESASTGSVRAFGENIRIGATPRVHVRIDALLDALQGFAKQDVSLHLGESAVVYATTPGYLPEGHPPRLAAVPTANPAPPQQH